MKKYRPIYFAVLAFSLLTSLVRAQEKDFPVLKGPYLGQKPPGDSPLLFAPGIVSTGEDEYAFEISCSGNEMLFVRKNRIMLVGKNVDGTWNKPIVAPFSGEFTDDEPFFSPSGQEIYFMSRRPSSNSKYPSNLWVTQKKEDKWMKPIQLNTITPPKPLHAPSMADNGNIYEDGIIKYRRFDGKYSTAEKVVSLKGMSPFISPDESYIIYAARISGKRDSDLYISFRNSDGTWSNGVSLGSEINSLANEANAFVTADRMYLFFSRKFDIYWVDARVIKELKPKH
jgi:hypothetical protein